MNAVLGQVARVSLLILICGVLGCTPRAKLPAAPAYEELRFSESLQIVQDQVSAVYNDWQQAPLDAERNGRLGMHLSIYRKSVVAEIFYRRAHLLAPDEFRWSYYLAFTLHDLGRNEEAIEEFRNSLKLRPDYPQAQIKLADLLLADEQVNKAKSLYESVIANKPDRVEPWLGLGKIHFSKGDMDAALLSLERAVEFGSQFGEVHYARMLAFRSKGNADAAAKAMAQFEKFKNNKIRIVDSLLLEVGALHVGDTMHMAQAKHFNGAAEYEKAAESFRSAIAANPSNEKAWSGLISALGNSGLFEQAKSVYREALGAGADHILVHMAWGHLLNDYGKVDEAAKIIDIVLGLDPTSIEAKTIMGQIELQRKHFGKAAEYLHDVTSNQPQNDKVKLQLAQALLGEGDFNNSIKILKDLASVSSANSPAIQFELAKAYWAAGVKDQALDTINHSRKLAWGFSDIRLMDAIDAELERWSQSN